MSDNIPFDIQVEIIKRLPIKSLIRSRLVSKQWNSLITSSEFNIAEYHTPQKHKHHLLVGFDSGKNNYVSIMDDDTFPQHKVGITAPTAFQLHRNPDIVSSQGLLFMIRSLSETTTECVIWNPTIRKSVHIYVSDIYHTNFGFGVCPNTYDPKIVKYKFNYLMRKREFEIFTLGTNAWRRLHNNLPRDCVTPLLADSQIAIDRFMYWSASESIYVDGTHLTRKLIVSFDMISEEFTEIFYPDSLAVWHPLTFLYFHNIRDSLVVVQSNRQKQVCSVWKMMENGVSKSFTKLYTINTTDVIRTVYDFRKSGEPIVLAKQNNPQGDLFAYDPDLKRLNCIGILGTQGYCCVSSYIETLLLLDHRDCSIYFDMIKGIRASVPPEVVWEEKRRKRVRKAPREVVEDERPKRVRKAPGWHTDFLMD